MSKFVDGGDLSGFQTFIVSYGLFVSSSDILKQRSKQKQGTNSTAQRNYLLLHPFHPAVIVQGIFWAV